MDTLRVLVADDEPGMIAAVARVLDGFSVELPDIGGKVSFEVEEAGTGEEALDKIDASPPHILLLDYKLPGISGLEVLDRLTAQKLDMLTIMITAYASFETAVSATKRGAYDFLAKPFTPDELTNTIRKAAGRLILAQQARKLAREQRRVRFEFIRVLAHELKAPIGAIAGYLRILRDRPTGDDPALYAQVIARSLIRLEGMRKMIGDLLDLTRIESGQRERELAEVDVRTIAEAAIDSVTPDADEHHLTIHLEAGAPVCMTADPTEIEIILNNMVSNAVKYNRDGGRVDVAVTRDDHQVKIAVSDTGIGMTSDEAAGLFKDFVRVKSDKTKDILGSGLGLSIVKKLAVLYGGDVAVESQPDVGSTFTVVLADATT